MTMGGTVIDSQFESILEKDLSDILSDSHYFIPGQETI